MPSLASFLMGMTVPIVRRVLIALGIGLVTYTGITEALAVIQGLIVANVGGLSGASSQVAALLGFHEAVGILLGGITTRISLVQLTKWGRI